MSLIFANLYVIDQEVVLIVIDLYIIFQKIVNSSQ